jgi:phenylalanyl-tRNA synthetase alpha chain
MIEKKKIKVIEKDAIKEIDQCSDLKELEALRIKYLGRKSTLSKLLSQLGTLPSNERPEFGKLLNQTKNKIKAILEKKKQELQLKSEQEKLKGEYVDITMPGKTVQVGARHILFQVMEEIEDIFIGMGFEIADGPEIETEYYNFDALNTPEWHPARELSDTFYLKNGKLLRTQTSPVQVRVMEKYPPPIRIISPGRCYRNDKPDASHSPVFHQVEGLVVDENVTLPDLKGTLDSFLKQLFGKEVQSRFRPHFFPFTEPSAEVDIQCIRCKGKGCVLCKKSGWVEIAGAGMVHPAVLKQVNYDPEKFTGFAFGLGIERIVVIRYNIPDIRMLFSNDLRFLEQFI